MQLDEARWILEAAYHTLRPTGDLHDDLEALYELEYKLSQMKSRRFEGAPQRKRNTVSRAERLLKQLVASVAKALAPVYEEWLDKHAITDPRLWAKKRTEDDVDMGGDVANPQEEFRRYTRRCINSDDIIDKLGKFDSLHGIGQDLLYDRIQMWEEDEGTEERERLENEISDAERDVKNAEEQLADWKADPDMNDDAVADAQEELEDYRETLRDLEKELDDLENPYEDWTEEEILRDALDSYGGINGLYELVYDKEGFIQDLYQHLVFPVWFNYWKHQGIEHTHRTLERAFKDLKRLSTGSGDAMKMSAKINEIINLSHQTGSMLDYIERYHDGVDQSFLDDLSDSDTDGWDEDLRKMGFVPVNESLEVARAVLETKIWDPKKDKDYRFWGSAGAGLLIIASSTGRILLPWRSKRVKEGNTWGVIGGAIDGFRETPEEGARREFQEETRYRGPLKCIPAYVFRSPGGFQYHNFIGIVPQEFPARGDWETEFFQWMSLEELEEAEPKHFGLKALLDDEPSMEIIRRYAQ